MCIDNTNRKESCHDPECRIGGALSTGERAAIVSRIAALTEQLGTFDSSSGNEFQLRRKSIQWRLRRLGCALWLDGVVFE